tara:strand:+ start:382 stop:1368 length:987 start_codon:yes stop_codon:yes gene_type:complete
VAMNYIFPLFFFLLLIGCSANLEDKNNLTVYRFENSLFSSKADNFTEKKDIWDKKLGVFGDYFNNLLFTNSDDSTFRNSVLDFVDHPDMREVYDSISKNFADFSIYENQLSSAIINYNNLLPEKQTPHFITMFSGFNYGVISYDSIVAIGLDFYLGENSVFYDRLGNPEYLKFQKQTKFMIPNIFESLFNRDFELYDRESIFLAKIIYKGKIMFFLNKILPKFNKSTKLRFSNNQLIWCKENEFLIWSYFIENNLLFSSKENDYRSYLDYSPFSKGMPKNSPGRIAYFIGGNIIESYMKNNKNISFAQLMQNTDYNNILTQSKYKPKK